LITNELYLLLVFAAACFIGISACQSTGKKIEEAVEDTVEEAIDEAVEEGVVDTVAVDTTAIEEME